MNIKDIAKLAGVSVSTVSKIVNQKDQSISHETRERVLKIVKEYNYAPYASSAGTPAKSWLLGVLLRSSTSLDATLDGIIQTAQKNGYSPLIFNNYDDKEQELKNITSLCKQNVDGVIWEPIDEESLSHLTHFEELAIPVLSTGENGGETSILFPYEKAAYHITQELIDQKHQKIACLLTPGRRTEAFLAGYKKCLFDNHMKLDPELIFFDFNENLNHKLNNRQITGVISSHYHKALEFYQLLHALSYKIPEDLSLISLKSERTEPLSLSELSEISTYTIRNADFGGYLCRQLINTIEKKSLETPTYFQDFSLDNRTTVSLPFNLNIPKIVVIGSINIDTYLTVPKLPDSGKTVSITGSSIYPGGKGVNQSIGAAKLGHRVALIGKIGSDLDSDYVYNTLNQFGVETLGIKRSNHTNTGKAYIFVETSGHSTISILPGANGIFTPEDIEDKKELFENTGYCLIQTEIPLDTVAKACSVAHQYGAKTILKPSAYGSIPKEVLSAIDILIPNEDELNELCPEYTTLEEKSDHLLTCGVDTIIVTLGEKGCYVKTAEWDDYVPAVDFPAIDSTGASDAFISALSSYLLYGYTLKDAVRIATYAAGFCISRDGVVSSLIDKHELEAHIKQKETHLIKE
ncbi:PfkB family carbohydrate kinase [Enterococcus sp. AZ192]|uniref:PfkB family carbohydrate kinase n=1 Tax=unclassified Enterococcus TaxID=2608891 RepID=UPI003D2A643B